MIVDEGGKRSYLDRWVIDGHENGNKDTIATTNTLLRMGVDGFCNQGGESELSEKEILDFHERHIEAAEFACMFKKNIMLPASSRAAIARTFYSYREPNEEKRLTKFMQILKDGTIKGWTDGDIAANKLRSWLESHKKITRGERNTVYTMTLIAINKFMNREQPENLRIPKNIREAEIHKVYKLPEERKFSVS